MNRFFARASTSTGEPELYCEGNGKTGSAQPLVEGVEKVYIKYWLAAGAAALEASALTADQWPKVVAVDLCVLVRGAPGGQRLRYVDCDGISAIGSDTRAAGVLASRGGAQSRGGSNVTITHTAKRTHTHTQAHHAKFQRGVVLPIVLLISAMVLATSAAWFETSLAAGRDAANVRDYLQAFHAADSALNACARNVITAESGDSKQPLLAVQPAQWKVESAFETGATAPFAQWPGSVRAPQCLIEPWRLASRANAQAYLLTARGFGRSKDSQVWLQLELVIENGTSERHWRRVAARPF
ncbi:MAG: Type IV fimbrial biogenesis protein PilW [uncultured Paraburkholderia sp.]|nr:MAG: Type IV fimbrial biogenesis protein PilW [uncultured Paraburkholderia sp.]CAH2920585.1 MAG: Type IV fimbrial biogenesis protein PilW [uncultured Paraburkholderia sp.]